MHLLLGLHGNYIKPELCIVIKPLTQLLIPITVLTSSLTLRPLSIPIALLSLHGYTNTDCMTTKTTWVMVLTAAFFKEQKEVNEQMAIQMAQLFRCYVLSGDVSTRGGGRELEKEGYE